MCRDLRWERSALYYLVEWDFGWAVVSLRGGLEKIGMFC